MPASQLARKKMRKQTKLRNKKSNFCKFIGDIAKSINFTMTSH